MSHRWRITAVLFCLGIVPFACTGEPNPIKELNPREVRFAADKITLTDALADLKKQTGNVVLDRRAEKTNPIVTFAKQPTTFWRALDAIGKQTNLGFSTYQPDGGVALVDRPFREMKTAYNGLFRFTVKRVVVSLDAETNAHLCRVAIEVAWEPRFRPLFLNLEQGTLGREKLERQAATDVARAGATEIEMRAPAPTRATPKINLLTGTVRVVGVPRMLEFTFAKPAEGMMDVQDGINVRLAEVKQFASRWAIDVEADEPAGAKQYLESFRAQAWMHTNRVWLAWNDLELEPIGAAPSRKGPGMVYTFTSKGTTPLPPPGAKVVLHYRTPNRVTAFTVPFSFRDLPLP